MITSEEIKKRLWDGATELRGSMDASRYKDYMLGLMFYKFLSDKEIIIEDTGGFFIVKLPLISIKKSGQ